MRQNGQKFQYFWGRFSVMSGPMDMIFDFWCVFKD